MSDCRYHQRIGPKHSDGCYSDKEHEAHIGRFREQLKADFRRYRGMDASLRLKMSVTSVKAVYDNKGEKTQEEIALTCVYDTEGPNKQWSKWTPSGSLSFIVSNPAAFGKVLPGQFYFVDLIATDKDAA